MPRLFADDIVQFCAEEAIMLRYDADRSLRNIEANERAQEQDAKASAIAEAKKMLEAAR